MPDSPLYILPCIIAMGMLVKINICGRGSLREKLIKIPHLSNIRHFLSMDTSIRSV